MFFMSNFIIGSKSVRQWSSINQLFRYWMQMRWQYVIKIFRNNEFLHFRLRLNLSNFQIHKQLRRELYIETKKVDFVSFLLCISLSDKIYEK